MNTFKRGDTVTCVDNVGLPRLEIGKDYKVVNVASNWDGIKVMVYNTEMELMSSRFINKTLSEFNNTLDKVLK